MELKKVLPILSLIALTSCATLPRDTYSKIEYLGHKPLTKYRAKILEEVFTPSLKKSSERFHRDIEHLVPRQSYLHLSQQYKKEIIATLPLQRAFNNLDHAVIINIHDYSELRNGESEDLRSKKQGELLKELLQEQYCLETQLIDNPNLDQIHSTLSSIRDSDHEVFLFLHGHGNGQHIWELEASNIDSLSSPSLSSAKSTHSPRSRDSTHTDSITEKEIGSYFVEKHSSIIQIASCYSGSAEDMAIRNSNLSLILNTTYDKPSYVYEFLEDTPHRSMAPVPYFMVHLEDYIAGCPPDIPFHERMIFAIHLTQQFAFLVNTKSQALHFLGRESYTPLRDHFEAHPYFMIGDKKIVPRSPVKH